MLPPTTCQRRSHSGSEAAPGPFYHVLDEIVGGGGGAGVYGLIEVKIFPATLSSLTAHGRQSTDQTSAKQGRAV